MTDFPIVLKGITNVEDAKIAVSKGVAGITLSNHGDRQLDGSPSPFQVALAIHDEVPEIFQQTEVLADCGVRYGTDVLKFLALGVKAVRPWSVVHVCKCLRHPVVERAIELLKTEILLDAINLGVTDLSQLNSSYVSFEPLIQD
jgi:isopentenyl diphosphate isomerase/L-lactate dehydrogenase-like FMN-dependent dehydrogenase